MIYKGVIRLFQICPMWLIHLCSDGLYILLFHLTKYRLKVVLDNLNIAFPEKTAQEKKEIARKFYRNLCDNILETLKGLTLTEKELKKRFVYKNPEIFDQDFEETNSVLVLGAHFANWEWGVISFNTAIKHQAVGIYKPIKNKSFEKIFNHYRVHRGLKLAKMSQAGRAMVRYRNAPAAFVFIMDQSPSDVDHAHWVDFFGRPTAFHHGVDKIARKTNFPVYYYDIIRTKRGHYEVFFKKIALQQQPLSEGELTKLYAQVLEESIRATPEDWLWSHRRWKRKPPISS